MAELILSLKDRELSRYALSGTMRIGRDPESEIYIDNVGVSRLHATVMQQGTTFAVRDEGSANGVHVNGERVEHRALQDGDVVQIGKFSLKLNVSGSGGSAPPMSAALSQPTRDLVKTFQMNKNEVQKLIAEQQAAETGTADEGEEDSTMKILAIGLLVIAVIAVASYFVLIR